MLLAVVAEVGHGARLVVVVKEEGVPRLALEVILPLGQVLAHEADGLRLVGPLAELALRLHVLKLEDHAQLAAVHVGVLGGFLDGDAGGLADGQKVVLAEHLLVHFLEELVYARAVLGVLVVAAVDSAGGHRAVRQAGHLGDQADDVHAETVDALLAPPVHHVKHSVADLRVLPVEVGLLRGEQVQVVLAGSLVKRPRRAAEPRAPVVGTAAVFLRVAPDVEVAVRVVLALLGLDEPLVLEGRMVDDEVHDDLDAALMRRGEHLVKVRHRAELVHDILIVADIIAVVVVGGFIHRREPDHVDAQLLQVIKAAGDTLDIAYAVAVAVHEAARINLVDDSLFPPCFLHMLVLLNG